MIDKIETGKRGKTFNKQQTINPKTGEISEILLIGSPQEFDKNFTKVFHAFTETLIKDERVAGKAIRLLFWIMKELETGSIEFYMNYSVIKEELNISRATYHNWVKLLKEVGIIKKVRPSLYMINPACVVKGAGHRLLDEFRNPRLPLEEDENE